MKLGRSVTNAVSGLTLMACAAAQQPAHTVLGIASEQVETFEGYSFDRKDKLDLVLTAAVYSGRLQLGYQPGGNIDIGGSQRFGGEVYVIGATHYGGDVYGTEISDDDFLSTLEKTDANGDKVLTHEEVGGLVVTLLHEKLNMWGY